MIFAIFSNGLRHVFAVLGTLRSPSQKSEKRDTFLKVTDLEFENVFKFPERFAKVFHLSRNENVEKVVANLKLFTPSG